MHLERLIEIKRQRFNALLITHVTWHHLDGPSEIQRPRLNRNDLQSKIKWRSDGYTHFVLSIEMFFDIVNHYRTIRLIELFRHQTPWMSCFESLLDSFSRPQSVWKWDFIERIGRNQRLNINDHVFEVKMKSLESGNKLDQVERNLGLGIMFHPNLHLYSFRFQF